MALDPKKWTLKTQEAMAAAIDQAKANANPEITPDHVLAAPDAARRTPSSGRCSASSARHR